MMNPEISLPNSHASNGFHSSNSTANLFLGSVKRAWMTDLGHSSSPRSVRSQHVPAANHISPYVTASSHPGDSHLPLSASVGPSTDRVVISPVTPGETTPHPNPASLPSTTCSKRAESVPVPPSPLLPSPAPSARNLADGTENPSRAAPSISPGTRPTQPAQAQSDPPEAMAARYSTAVNHDLGVSSAHSNASQTSQIQQSPGPSPTLTLNASGDATEKRIDEYFWSLLLRKVDFLVRCSSTQPILNDHVTLARVCLLRDACAERDLLYLALHQVYCMRTCDPEKMARLNLDQVQVSGFQAVQQLLVENQQLPPSFVKWAADFPFDLDTSMQYPEYRGALLQLSQSLGLLAVRLRRFSQEVAARRYPPLIDELVNEFGVTSSVLLQILFVAMARGAFGSNHESRLQSLFLQNKWDYERRFLPNQPPPSDDQMRRQNNLLIREYRKITSLDVPTLSRPGGSLPVGQRPAQPSGNPNALPATSNASPTTPGSAQPARLHSATPNARDPAASPIQRYYFPSEVVGRQSRTQSADGSLPVPHSQSQNMQDRRPLIWPVTPPIAVVSQSQRQALESQRRPYQTMQNPHPTAIGNIVRQENQHPLRQHRQQRLQPNRGHMFLPPAGAPPPNNARPNPLRLALHQAHLRDPIKKLARQSASGEELVELFQFFTSFMVPPTLLGQIECLFNWKFSLSSADCERIPRLSPTRTGHRPIRVFHEGCRTYHLRCIKASPSTSTEDLNPRAWSVAESAWPSVIYIFVNGVEHFVRRKVHNGKDLPLDITDALREGENDISFHFLRNPAETRDALYAAAVELMGVSNLDQTKQLAQILPAAETNERVQKQLLSSCADDEMCIVNDDISVNLVDPFTARVFKIPARGVDCPHLECFDFDTYLMTKSSKTGKGPMEFNWRCPICGKDARPQSLVIDNYLVNVRADLERNDQLEDAKSIRIKADGSWELKVDQDMPAAERGGLTAGPVPRKRIQDDVDSPRPAQRIKTHDSLSPRPSIPATEVIELD